MKTALRAVTALTALVAPFAQAIDLDVNDSNSIKNAASTVAYGLLSYYTGNVTNTPETIAILPGPYYWWEAGAMWGAMVDYYYYTGDSSYYDVTTQAILSQIGPLSDFMVPLHEKDEGNDDQAFWGFAAMSAAEKGLPEPTTSQYSWLQLTENLWNTQVRRWDTSSCGGGLKWQIFEFNKGYHYKNSISNGAFFQLSARLARFTGNQTYLDWALKSYEWSTTIGLIDSDYHVFDGGDDTKNCADPNRVVWTYNTAVYLYGSAVLYNHTGGSDVWEERTRGFLKAASGYFDYYRNSTNTMCETACETVNTCNVDQFSFKGYLSRFMWASTLVAPFTKDEITTYLQGSAKSAARACSGGDNGVTCGQRWYWDVPYDGSYGVGQQMSALETIQGLLASESAPPIRRTEAQDIPPKVSSSASRVPTAEVIAVNSIPIAPTTKRNGAEEVVSAPRWVFGVLLIGAALIV